MNSPSPAPPSPRRQSRQLGVRVAQALGSLAIGGCLALAFARPGALAPTDATPEPLAARTQPARQFEQPFEVHAFLRGDLHAHSAISDGDSPAETVIRHYRDRGYHFFALTDHNRRLAIDDYQHLETDDFVLLGGEEITMAAKGLPIHVNALCTEREIGGAHFDDRVQALKWAVSRINAQDGVALINHPNFYSALDAEHIAAVKGAHLLEIYNGHPHVFSDGRGKRQSVETLWDTLLSSGSTLAAVAVDDMHMLAEDEDSGVPHSLPATGWVEVFGDTPERVPICDALRAGRLYASNGPQLAGIAVTADRLTVRLRDHSQRVTFVGFGGQVLAESTAQETPDGWQAEYFLRGHEPFVRARVTATDGTRAWTQAYRTRR